MDYAIVVYSEDDLVIESDIFSKHVYDYLSEADYVALQSYLIMNPSAGDLIQGSGGVRKLRWGRRGFGKSGGMRVLYYSKPSAGKIFLLLIYSKSARDSFPGHLVKAIKEAMEDETE